MATTKIQKKNFKIKKKTKEIKKIKD